MSDEAGVKYRIEEGYSYARDRLRSHMEMASGPQKTLEVLDDVVRVIDEYCSFSDDRTVGPYNFVELTQYLAETLPRGLGAVVAAQKEIKMMEPILAGLRKIVLISDCGVPAGEIPDAVEAVLALQGPEEVDDVVAYLLASGLLSDPKPAGESAAPPKSGACFVATVAFDGYDAPEVLILRRFRDERLASSPMGRASIHLYYLLGPHLASLVNRRPRIKRIVRSLLTRAVRRLDRGL